MEKCATTPEGPMEYVNARWMGVNLHGFPHGIMFHGHLEYFQKTPLGGRPNTNHDTLNAHNYWFILFYHVWGPAWIKIHWNSIRLRARSHMTSHYTWGPVTTTLHDFGSVLRWPLDTFIWALTISWSPLLACVYEVALIRTSSTPLNLVPQTGFGFREGAFVSLREVAIIYPCCRRIMYTFLSFFLPSFLSFSCQVLGLVLLETHYLIALYTF